MKNKTKKPETITNTNQPSLTNRVKDETSSGSHGKPVKKNFRMVFTMHHLYLSGELLWQFEDLLHVHPQFGNILCGALLLSESCQDVSHERNGNR